MTLVEKHVIQESNSVFPILDELCYKSKNLYNATLYYIRQEYFKSKIYTGYYTVQKEFQNTNNFDYRELPSKVSQQTMKLVDQNFKSFFRSVQEYKKNPNKFKGRPKIPKYLDPVDGRFIVTYTYQCISKKEFKNTGKIKLEKLPKVLINTKIKNFDDICQVRIIPRGSHIVIEVVYEKQEIQLKQDNGVYAGIDLGVNNLITLTTNIINEKPIIYSGKRVKSWNHYYNKSISHYKSLLSTVNRGKRKGWSKRLERITFKREMKINDYFHKIAKDLVTYLDSKHINTLIVGNNKGWKQNINLGKVNNQGFIQIPFSKLINILSYKCRLKGINVIVISEEYTSLCSFLDNESIQKHSTYLGKRVHRGLFISGAGRLINSDVNGSFNIIKKCKPGAFNRFPINRNGVMGVVVHPIILNI